MKFRRVIAVVLSVAMLCGLLPVTAMAGSTPSVSMVASKVDKFENVYKLSVSATSTERIQILDVILTIDSETVELANRNTGAGIAVSDGDNNTTNKNIKGAFTNPLIDEYEDAVYTQAIAIAQPQDRMNVINIYATLSGDTGITADNDLMYEMYFKLKDGKTADDLRKGTIKIETNKNALDAFTREYGVIIKTQGGSVEYDYPDTLTASLSYPNSSVQALGSMALTMSKGSVNVSKDTQTVTVSSLTAKDIEGDTMTVPSDVTYSVTQAAGVSIDPSTGTVSVDNTAQSGNVTVTAASGSVKATADIQIVRAPAALTKLNITTNVPNEVTALSYQTEDDGKSTAYDFTVAGEDQFGTVMETGALTYQYYIDGVENSFNPPFSVADGKLTVNRGADAGTYKVVVASGSIFAEKTFRVIHDTAPYNIEIVDEAGKVNGTTPVDGYSVVRPESGSKTLVLWARADDKYGVESPNYTIIWGGDLGSAIATDGNKATITINPNMAIKDYTLTASTSGKTGTTKIKVIDKIMLTVDMSGVTVNGLDANKQAVYGTVLSYTGEASAKLGEDIKDAAFEYGWYTEDGAKLDAAPVHAGKYKLVASVNDDTYAGEGEIAFTITPKPLIAEMLTVTGEYTYNGQAQTPTYTVKDGTTELVKDTDYTVVCTNNTNAGEATITITGMGNYTGNVSKSFTIARKALADSMIQPIAEQTYDGTALTPEVVVVDGSATLVQDTDYTVDFTNNTAAGTATVTVTGQGNYTGTANGSFTINPKVTTFVVTLDKAEFEYNGDVQKPQTVTVKDGDRGLTVDTDYTVAYTNGDSKNAGSYTVTVSGKENYAGSSGSATYQITKAQLTRTGDPVGLDAILANAEKNLDALKSEVQSKNPTLAATYANGAKTSTLAVSWDVKAGTVFDPKGGTYTFVGTLTPTDTDNFTYTGDTVSLDVVITPVTGIITWEKTALTKAKSQVDSAATVNELLGVGNTITVTYDNGVDSASYAITGWAPNLDALQGYVVAAADKTVDVAPQVTFPDWATIDTTAMKTALTITAKFPVTVTMASPANITFGGTLEIPTPAQTDLGNGVAENPQYSYSYEGTGDTDYGPSAEKPTAAGTYTVTATLVNDTFSGVSAAMPFTINPKSLTAEMLTVNGEYIYNGLAQTANYTMTDGQNSLVHNEDYTVAYSDNTNAGTATITVTGKCNYTGEVSKTFTIAPKALESSMIQEIAAQTYDGTEKMPEPVVKYGTLTLIKDTDYTVAYADNLNAGSAAKVTVTAKENGNYSGSAEKTFTIDPKVTTFAVTVEPETFEYTGAAQKPAVTVKDGNKTLAENTDYTITWPEDVTNVGTKTINVTGNGNYAGSTGSTTYAITKVSQTELVISGVENKTFGDADFGITVSGGSGTGAYTLVSSDPTVLRVTEKAAGVFTAKILKVGEVTLTAGRAEDNNYQSAEKTQNLTVSAKSVSDAVVELPDGFTATYTGSAFTPAVTVKVGQTTLTKDTDYTVAYSDNTNAGTATITVTGKGNYTGEVSKTFTIAPASVAEKTPSVTGTAQVGNTLEARLDVINYNDDDFNWNWKRGETTVGTERSYVLTAADSGANISVTATAKDGTNYTGTTLAGTVTVAKMTISGTIVVNVTSDNGTVGTIDAGDTLTAAITGITPAEAQKGGSFQWYRNNQSIEGQTEATYVVTAEDADAVLKVVYTPADQFAGTVSSADIEVGKTVLTGTLTVTGDGAVENTLTAELADGPDAEFYDILWLRNGTEIPGAVGNSYVVVKADQGKTVSAKAVAKGSYTGVVLAANEIDVPAAAPDAPVLTASAGNGQVTLHWSTPDNNGAPILSYVLKQDGEEIAQPTVDATSYTVTGLTNGTAYTFTLTVANREGSSTSAEVTAIPAAPWIPTEIVTDPKPSDADISAEDGTVNVTVPANKDKDGGFSAEISRNDAQKLVDAAKENSGADVVISPKVDDNAQKVAVTLPAKAVSGIAENSNAGVVISTPIADVHLKNEAMESLAKQGEKVSVSAEKNNDGTVNITVSAGNKQLSEISGGMTAVVPAEENAGSGLVAVQINPDGTEEIIRYSSLTEDGLAVQLDGSATIILKDNTRDFEDIEQHWAEDNINFITARQIFNGTSDTTFAPDTDMTRAMIVTVLYNLDGNIPVEQKNFFNDVAESTWYTDAVDWAAENEIVSGIGNGVFAPEQNVSREQMALILYGYAQKIGLDISGRGELSQYKDADSISDWAREAMEWAVDFGLINGKDGNLLDPNGNATRAEVATVVRRFVESVVK